MLLLAPDVLLPVPDVLLPEPERPVLLALPLPVLLVLADCCVLLLSVPLRLLLPEEYLLSSVLIYILLRRGACLFIIS